MKRWKTSLTACCLALLIAGCDKKSDDKSGDSKGGTDPTTGQYAQNGPPEGGPAPPGGGGQGQQGGGHGQQPPGMPSGQGMPPGMGDSTMPPGMGDATMPPGSYPTMPPGSGTTPPGMGTETMPPGSYPTMPPGTGTTPPGMGTGTMPPGSYPTMPPGMGTTPPGMGTGTMPPGSYPTMPPGMGDGTVPPGMGEGGNPPNYGAGPGGVPGAEGGARGAGPPSFDSKTPEYAVVQFALAAGKGDVKKAAKYVAKNATGDVAEVRSGKLGDFKSELARVKFFDPRNTSIDKRGTKVVVLLNDKGNIAHFTLDRQGEAYYIKTVRIRKAPRTRATPRRRGRRGRDG